MRGRGESQSIIRRGLREGTLLPPQGRSKPLSQMSTQELSRKAGTVQAAERTGRTAVPWSATRGHEHTPEHGVQRVAPVYDKNGKEIIPEQFITGTSREHVLKGIERADVKGNNKVRVSIDGYVSGVRTIKGTAIPKRDLLNEVERCTHNGKLDTAEFATRITGNEYSRAWRFSFAKGKMKGDSR